MASVSKDGTWKFWDTNIRYQMGQDPYLLYTGQFNSPHHSLISLSPDARTVTIATNSSLTVFNTADGNEEQVIPDVFSGGVTWLGFDLTSRYFLAAGDKHIHVFHNVAGYKAAIVDLSVSEKKASSQAMRERIQQQIQEARDRLQSITGEANGTAKGK